MDSPTNRKWDKINLINYSLQMSHSDILLQALHWELSRVIGEERNRGTVSWPKCKQAVHLTLSRNSLMVVPRQLPLSPTCHGADVFLLEKLSTVTRGHDCDVVYSCSLHWCSGHLAESCQKTRPQFFPGELFSLWILNTVTVEVLNPLCMYFIGLNHTCQWGISASLATMLHQIKLPVNSLDLVYS